ncbi:hypothetical protein FB451DRAFT_1188200 [Mycena latifolia]|nr:hypothetical protein FB451DRAFT_1188200 [Mycena latifolia]
MSNHPRPDSGMAAFSQPTRIYMACVNCRAGKIKCISPGNGQPCARFTKRRLECEYLPVPDEQARAGSTTNAGRRSRKQPPPPSTPTPHLPSGSTQAPRSYGGSDRGSPPYPVQGYFPPGPQQSSSQFNPEPTDPARLIEPTRYLANFASTMPRTPRTSILVTNCLAAVAPVCHRDPSKTCKSGLAAMHSTDDVEQW